MKRFLGILPIFFVVLAAINRQDEDEEMYCYASDDNPHRFYGTKTTYNHAFDYLKSSVKNISIPPSCSPKMVYVFKRHAIRYPDGKDIPVMEKVLGKLRTHILESTEKGSVQMCKKDIESLRKWTLNMKPEDDNSITETGFKETELIAKRLRERYPDLLDPEKRLFDVTVSNRIRTTETANSFLGEISKYYQHEEPFNPQVNDVSDFHSVCEDHLLEQGVTLSKPTIISDFIKGDLMKSVRTNVSNRIGLNYTLTWKELKVIYRGCSFGYSIYADDSWCALFSKDDMKILEYYEDLDDYYADAYGRTINIRAPCSLTTDLIQKILATVNITSGSSTHKIGTYLRFSHAGAMKQLVSHFGLFDDFPPPILHSSTVGENECTKEQIKNSKKSRLWKSSLIAPFSCNFQFVLYHCPPEVASIVGDELSEYHLATFLQEFPVVISGCDDELCPLNQFLNQYQSLPSSLGQTCNLKEICRI